MKKVIFAVSFFLICSLANARNFEITPIMLNFKGVVVNDNITVAYADFGSALISRDYDKSWEQIRIFPGGNIVDIFFSGEEMVAFNDRGDIAKSNNFGATWSQQKLLQDSVFSVVDYPDGYLLRMRHKLMTISKEFEKINEFEIESPELIQINIYTTTTYNKSLVFAEDKFIAEFDSSVFIRFDLDLIPIDTLNLLEHIELGKYRTGYRMFYELGYLYMRYGYTDGAYRAVAYRTNDFKNIEIFADGLMLSDYYYVKSGKYYSCRINRDKRLNDTTKVTDIDINRNFKESTVANGKQYIVGDRKIFIILDLQDSSVQVVSDYSGYSALDTPDKIAENTYIFYSSPFPSGIALYKTENNGTTILPTIDRTHPSFDSLIDSDLIRLQKLHKYYYDSEEKKIYFFVEPSNINQATFWVSDDEGTSFESRYLDMWWSTLIPFYRNGYINNKKTLIQKRDSNFIFASESNVAPSLTIFSYIETISKNGNYVAGVKDSNIIFTYCYSKDTNTYLVHSCDVIDSTSQFIFTNNGGKSWELIHKYPINETVGYISDIEVKGRKYIAITHYDFTNWPPSRARFLDVVDKETNEFTRIASWGNPEDDPEYKTMGIAITSDGDNAYISFQDTLFVVSDLFNKNTWSYYLLPEGGAFSVPIKKFGDKFFGRYVDYDNPFGTGMGSGMHWIKPLGTLYTSVEEQTERLDTYLYAYPTYPNPATNNIRTQVYWDRATDVNAIDISIYNIYGEKVSSKENISIEIVDSNSGYLNWDCSNQEPGVYLIKINNGKKFVTRKVLVVR